MKISRLNKILLDRRHKFAPKEKVFNNKKRYSRKNFKIDEQ